jgi:hypothetical protein
MVEARDMTELVDDLLAKAVEVSVTGGKQASEADDGPGATECGFADYVGPAGGDEIVRGDPEYPTGGVW